MQNSENDYYMLAYTVRKGEEVNTLANVVKVIELVSASMTGFEDAIKAGLEEAKKTVRGIKGVDVIGLKATVENDQVKDFRAHLKIAFEIER
ncbi:MAG: dodecin domain-containing protein [Methanobacteriota archaeon]|nr:MAG: dodecin domain-containing protein [Euryarchaeota archaeon]